MRTFMAIMFIGLAGCSGTAKRPRPIVSPVPPIVSKTPTLSQKMRFSNQQGDQQLAKCEVSGNVVR